MEPTIHVGSLLLLLKPADPSSIEPGDVITYSTTTDPDGMTTHRVISVATVDGEPAFQTQGDANDSPDSGEVAGSDVLGRVVSAIPYVGYICAIARSRAGFLGLVALPAVLLVCGELFSIAGELRGKKLRARGERAREIL